jgi:hypothetical protein
MGYKPQPVPFDVKEIPRFLERELRRVADTLADASEAVFYRTMPVQAVSLSISNGISANWRVAGNVLLISSSVTITLTGIQRDAFVGNRELVLFNIGTGVVCLKSAGTESSASNRFVLNTNWNLSAGAAATLWRDPFAFRWRGLSRTS